MAGWDLSCLDWESRLREGRSMVTDLPLNDAMAARAVQVFDRLRLPDVVGKPKMAEAAGDWFRDIVRAVFGSYDPATQERYIRELFLLVPKKNAKTTNGAALTLTAALLNERPRAELLYVGPTQSIADLGFGQTLGMIEADNDLAKRVHVQEHLRKITIRKTGAEMRVKTFDTKVMTGTKPIWVLVDELHELGSMAKADKVIRQIRGGLLANWEGFLTFITTQSDDPPRGVFRRELNKARQIRDGKSQGNMLAVTYEFPSDMVESKAWREPANWPMVNPNIDRSVTVARLKELEVGAETDGEEDYKRWASQHLNIEIGIGLMSGHWPGAEFWQAAGDIEITLETIKRTCDVAVVGIDGGGLDDLLGVAVIGREKVTRRWLLWCQAFAHESVLARRKKEASMLRDLEAAGDLSIVDIGEDIQGIVAIVTELEEAGILAEKNAIGLDPVGVGAIVDALVEAEIESDDEEGTRRIVAVSQGYKLNGAIKTTERKLVDGTLVHGDQPLMTWCVGNAKVEQKGNAVLITKQISGSAKIDPLMAAFNAVALMSMNPIAAGARVSAWEDEDFGIMA